MIVDGDSPVDLVDQVKRLCDLPLGPLRGDLGGSWSTNLMVGHAGDRVVRIDQEFVTEARLAAEQTARRALAAAAIPAVPPEAVFEGESIRRLRDGRLVEIEPYVRSTDTMTVPRRLVAEAGLLARVHDALAHLGWDEAARCPLYANVLDRAVGVDRVLAGAQRIRTWQDPALGDHAARVTDHVRRIEELERPLWPGLVWW